MVYGVWCMVYGVWCMVYGVRVNFGKNSFCNVYFAKKKKNVLFCSENLHNSRKIRNFVP